ncbi:hypothetical protein BJY01DRAFT_246220 [Aspergillus pseudoustus]|uniref:Uncharacterized protein n=1 Tax=Aspergillus pseudoustus TaxID=1810923 RepID=A0ABR4K979_9EURO
MWPSPFAQAGIPSDFVLDENNIRLPDSLKSHIPEPLSTSFENCKCAGLRALTILIQLSKYHEGRYEALCPRNPGDLTRWMRHSDSIARLREYYTSTRDTSTIPFSSSPSDIPSKPKIPSESVALVVNQFAYGAWAREFDGMLFEFVDGAYADYSLANFEFEQLMQAATNDRVFSGIVWKQVYSFYLERFLVEMGKWEAFVTSLVLPSFDELMDEIYWAIREGVEGGDQFAQMLVERRAIV